MKIIQIFLIFKILETKRKLSGKNERKKEIPGYAKINH